MRKLLPHSSVCLLLFTVMSTIINNWQWDMNFLSILFSPCLLQTQNWFVPTSGLGAMPKPVVRLYYFQVGTWKPKLNNAKVKLRMVQQWHGALWNSIFALWSIPAGPETRMVPSKLANLIPEDRWTLHQRKLCQTRPSFLNTSNHLWLKAKRTLRWNKLGIDCMPVRWALSRCSSCRTAHICFRNPSDVLISFEISKHKCQCSDRTERQQNRTQSDENDSASYCQPTFSYRFNTCGKKTSLEPVPTHQTT